jgi:hypothetical protein
MKTSILTKKQTRTYGPRAVQGYGPSAYITATVRYDDECGNGHNTFAITGEVTTPASRRRHDIQAGGCMHDDIARAFPELAPLLKWHLCSSDEPLHYLANTTYHALNRNLEYARSSAIWPDATLEQLRDKIALCARLPALLNEFAAAVESLGFTF